jgi:hypothetical protein
MNDYFHKFIISGGLESTVSSILDSIPMLVVGTNIGIALINVRTREIITALSFNHIFQQQPRSNHVTNFFRGSNHRISEDKNDGIFGSMISQLMFGSDENIRTHKDSNNSTRNKTKYCQTLIIMGQRTSDAKTFALSLNVHKNSKLSSNTVLMCSDVESSQRLSSAKGQTSFSVVAQTPAKRGSLFENMQRKHETMNCANYAHLNGNPTAILHGKLKSNGIRKMKSSISVPNLDKSETKEENFTIPEVPKLIVENTNKNVKSKKSSEDKNSNIAKKTKSSGYGKLCEKIKMFEPNLNPSGKKKRSLSTSQAKKKNGLADNHYYNPYHGHTPGLNRQQPERDNSILKGNDTHDGTFSNNLITKLRN